MSQSSISKTLPQPTPHRQGTKSATHNTTNQISPSPSLLSEYEGPNDAYEDEGYREMERKLVRKVDLRLCTIAGILCSLNLLDSGIISSASVTSIFGDLGLGVGNRYVSSSIFRAVRRL